MDVYSLGVVLYETVTGQRPVGDFAPLPPALDRIVRRALALDPDQRYARVEEMGRELSRVDAAGLSRALGPDEQNYVRAVALLAALSTALVLWAVLLSFSPKVIDAEDVQPLVMVATQVLPDGRVLSRARFEMWPALGALGTVALTVLAYGALRRHWRQAGLDRPSPEPLTESRAVLAWGLALVSLYGFRKLLQHRGHAWAATYIPILGGVMEVAALFLVWVAVLQAWRTGRPLRHELPLWLGLALTLVPPALELTIYLLGWRP
jgi:serine/threonine-protein kinase